MTTSPHQGRIRASDTERDTVAGRLRDAHAEGRLSYDELDARLGRALAATYRDELPVLVADLPSVGRTLSQAPSPRRRLSLPPLVVLAVLASVVLVAHGRPPFPLLWIALWVILWRSGGWRRVVRARAASGPARTG